MGGMVRRGASARAMSIGCALVALASVTGCADDDDNGNDAGTGGDGGGIENTGGRASGGTGGGASGGTGGAPPNAGGAESGGTGPATGGGTALPDSGTDASTQDASQDSGGASEPDAGDAAAPHGPLCPITTSFPAGSYTLRAVVANSYMVNPGSPAGPPYSADCSREREQETLTITPSPAGPPTFEIVLDAPASTSLVLEYTAVEAIESGESIRFFAKCGGEDLPPMCAPDTGDLFLEIDKRTGAVNALEVIIKRSFMVERASVIRATGWPRCPATEAAPPTWIPDVMPPDNLANNCWQQSAVPIGCRLLYDYDMPPNAFPRCPSSSFSCDNGVATCEDVVDGRIATCCSP